MAVIKEITIIFDPLETVVVGEFIDLFVTVGATTATYRETFVTQRVQAKQVSLGADEFENATNLANAINLDGTRVGLVATVFQNGVIVSLLNDSYYFETPTGTLISNSRVNISTSTANEVIPPNVTLNSYTAKSPFCTDVNAILDVVGGTNLYNVYVDNVLTLSSQTTPITLPLLRGALNSVRVVDTDDATIGIVSLSTPRKLITSDITTSVLNLNTGATLSISVAYISPFVSTYEYSLNNVDFQVSNVFAGLAVDTYTIYVRDAFGCVISKELVIDGSTTITETLFSISEINSISFSKYELGKKNYNNTLSCNELRLMPYMYRQEFLATDIITTQFKTNANYINVYAIDEDLNTTQLSAVKRTSNIGLASKSTSTYFDLGDGRSGIYFGVVDLLDPVTDANIGNADFGFTLPQWANTAGNYVTIEDIGQVQIDNIGYSDLYQSFILEFDIAYTGVAAQRNISAVYNLQPYEIYEFLTTMSVLPSEFNIVIEVGTSVNQIDFTYVSERIRKVEDNEFLFEIDYYDDKNLGDMVYQTGIRNKLRIKGLVEYLGEQTTEGYDGDKQFYVTDNTIYNVERFSFFRLSSKLLQKLRMVFTHTFLSVNGIEYKIADAPEISSSDGNTNLKNFFVTLKSGGNVILEAQSEVVNGTSETLELESLISASQGKAGLLWTKINA